MKKNPKVYVVDDDASVRKSLGGLLRAVGYEATTFAPGEIFWIRCHLRGRVSSSWILKCRGLAASSFIMLTAAGSNMRIFFITAHDSEPVRARASAAGVAILKKPFDDEALLAAIHGLEKQSS